MSHDAHNGSGPVSRPQRSDVTALLAELGRGNDAAGDVLFERIYDELRLLAKSRLRLESSEITLGTTELVHEAYLRLVPLDGVEWRDRSHFFATAARAMRRILIDHARTAKRLKRGGSARPVALGDDASAVSTPFAQSADALLELDEALGRLGELSTRQLRVVELRFFAGLSVPETAEVLGVAVNTVKRDWSTARAWLNRELAA
jgi:RNA polymerase sigma factor (TIGR02999 family)